MAETSWLLNTLEDYGALDCISGTDWEFIWWMFVPRSEPYGEGDLSPAFLPRYYFFSSFSKMFAHFQSF
jgi:hypothetical protein